MAATKRVPIVCHGHSRPIVEVNFSNITPDGYFLATASKDGQPMLRHGDTGDWYGTFQGHKGAVWSCVLNEPALLAVTGSADFSARVWDACSGNQLHEFQHKHIVRTTDFAHKHISKFATAGHEKIVRIFDLERPEAPPAEFPIASGTVRCVAWAQDDNLLLAALADKAGISVYDVRSMQQVQTIETASPVLSLEVSYDRRHITTTESRVVKVFDAASLQLYKELPLQKHSAESASYCAARRRIVTGGEDMWVHLYDCDTGQELECNRGHHGPVHTIRFAPTGDSYASGSEDGTIRLWWLDGDAPTKPNTGNDALRRGDQ